MTRVEKLFRGALKMRHWISLKAWLVGQESSCAVYIEILSKLCPLAPLHLEPAFVSQSGDSGSDWSRVVPRVFAWVE